MDLDDKPDWDAFYANPHTYEPSPFGRLAVDRRGPTVDDLWIDLGCGNGRDSFYFATHGAAVIGVDTSAVAVASASARRDDLGGAVSDRLTFIQSSVAGLSILDAAVAAARSRGQAVTVFSRFLVHSIERHDLSAMLQWLARTLSGSEVGLFEFRTPEDAGGEKVYPHFRTFCSASEFADHAREAGLSSLVLAEGHGLARYGGEDPVVARTEVRLRGLRV